jgi:RNA polymerase sigma factor (sigma-70 family)
MSGPALPPRRPGRPYMVAVVLGTALTALAPGHAAAARADADQAVADLGRYCTACWRNARLPVDAWGDCTQEVFRRLLERVPPADWGRLLKEDGDDRREFLRAIDAVKKRTQRARKFCHTLDGVADRREPHALRVAAEREQVREAAQELLTPRQQRILQLGFEGWSVHDTARELGLPPERVSDEKYKAIRKLRGRLAEAV